MVEFYRNTLACEWICIRTNCNNGEARNGQETWGSGKGSKVCRLPGTEQGAVVLVFKLTVTPQAKKRR